MIRSQNLQGILEFLQLALNVLQDAQHMPYEYSIHILLYRMSSFDLFAFTQNKYSTCLLLHFLIILNDFSLYYSQWKMNLNLLFFLLVFLIIAQFSFLLPLTILKLQNQ